MKHVRIIVVMMLGLGVTACGNSDTATRNAAFESTPNEILAQPFSISLAEMDVRVPSTLRVSEANRFLPGGDIVWRGDAYGNRYDQVKAIFEESVALGAEPLNGLIPTKVEIEVKRFHALTEKTRYSIGGIHSIEFVMTIIDPVTGIVLRGPKEIKADLLGYGGSKALQAEARGLTQKFRITQHLARVIRDEMSLPQGFLAPPGGVTKRVTPMLPTQPI
ncbi:DUF6778 family protein [Pseudopelagicola sp. nBUS_20]|uniref:DUF6778 family protein n=1 Tax=Pseudopelagicola sp. nBUS_20 TaxID=3395317 RepID=UPI003EBEA3DC